tara:strand:- start:73 stop:456 length:384 start_codon:yes stop_codon:yes gene_type:complete
MAYKNDKNKREKGMQILNRMGFLKSSGTPISSDFMDHIIEMLYGDIWSREDIIDIKERSLITLAVLVALNRENELKMHFRGARNIGITKEKIEEMILHVGHYSGIPTGVSANQILNDVWAQMDNESD